MRAPGSAVSSTVAVNQFPNPFVALSAPTHLGGVGLGRLEKAKACVNDGDSGSGMLIMLSHKKGMRCERRRDSLIPSPCLVPADGVAFLYIYLFSIIIY